MRILFQSVLYFGPVSFFLWALPQKLIIFYRRTMSINYILTNGETFSALKRPGQATLCLKIFLQ